MDDPNQKTSGCGCNYFGSQIRRSYLSVGCDGSGSNIGGVVARDCAVPYQVARTCLINCIARHWRGCHNALTGSPGDRDVSAAVVCQVDLRRSKSCKQSRADIIPTLCSACS